MRKVEEHSIAREGVPGIDASGGSGGLADGYLCTACEEWVDRLDCKAFHLHRNVPLCVRCAINYTHLGGSMFTHMQATKMVPSEVEGGENRITHQVECRCGYTTSASTNSTASSKFAGDMR